MTEEAFARSQGDLCLRFDHATSSWTIALWRHWDKTQRLSVEGKIISLRLNRAAPFVIPWADFRANFAILHKTLI